MARTFIKRTPEQIADQKATLISKADQGLADLADRLCSADTTEAMASWTQFMAKFHRYSLYNQLLIESQLPSATHCAGFGKWKELNRSVRKGEKGIAILAPIIRKAEAIAEESSDVRRIRGFRCVYVFDVSQTDGAPLPLHPAKNLAEASPADLARVEAAINAHCPVVEDQTPLRGGVMGWTDGKAIHVTAGQSSGSRLSVLFHELAHTLLHFDGEGKIISSDDLPKDVRELEAEATAAAMTAAMGYQFQGFSAAYMASYGATPETLKTAIPRIRKAVSAAVKLLTEKESEEAEEE